MSCDGQGKTGSAGAPGATQAQSVQEGGLGGGVHLPLNAHGSLEGVEYESPCCGAEVQGNWEPWGDLGCQPHIPV